MIARFIKRLEASLVASGADTPSAPLAASDIERVAALLLVEVARADQSIEPAELEAIGKAIASLSSLSVDEIDEMIRESIDDADAAISLHAHLRIVNEHFDKQQRIKLVENMWRVAYADGDLDRYEEHRIRSLSELLYVKHRDFMQAKHRASQFTEDS